MVDLSSGALLGPVLLVARVLMAAVFLIFGTYKAGNTARMQAYMTAHGVPGVLIYPVILLQIGGGAFVVLGYQTRVAALLLAAFCVVATILFHADFSNGNELAHFTKDMAIAGGFVFMIAYGPGPLSLDAYLGRPAPGRGIHDVEEVHSRRHSQRLRLEVACPPTPSGVPRQMAA
jgi:putative oxidoreductase